jgi:hypothetical protein
VKSVQSEFRQGTAKRKSRGLRLEFNLDQEKAMERKPRHAAAYSVVFFEHQLLERQD